MRARRFAGCCLLSVVAVLAVSPAVGRADDNPIVLENRLPGTRAWVIGQNGHRIADDQRGQIKGYASATSVAQAETLTLYVSVDVAQQYDVDVYRMGWYGGAGGRLMQHVTLTGTPQPACPVNAQSGMIECHWAPSLRLTIPDSWTTGVYVAVLTNTQGFQNYVVWVVRDDSHRAPLLYQMGVMTNQAYNNYPADGVTGKSLYDYNSYGPNTVAGSPRAVKVSFDRPYRGSGDGDFMLGEVYFVHWLERSGYDVSYSTDVDTHMRGASLLEHRALLSLGHDEYWTKEMYDAAEAALTAGVNLGFFGADAVYWQVRMESASDGRPNRTMVCYRELALDPVRGATSTVRWRDPPLSRPEQTLVGIQYGSGVSPNGALRVINTGHWVYEGTGFADGQTVAGILGDEVDRLDPAYPGPSAQSYVTLSSSPLAAAPPAESSLYQAPSGAWVFAAGTISWSLGLDGPLADARIQRVTANVLNRFIGVSSAVDADHDGFPAGLGLQRRRRRDSSGCPRAARQQRRRELRRSGRGLRRDQIPRHRQMVSPPVAPRDPGVAGQQSAVRRRRRVSVRREALPDQAHQGLQAAAREGEPAQGDRQAPLSLPRWPDARRSDHRDRSDRQGRPLFAQEGQEAPRAGAVPAAGDAFASALLVRRHVTRSRLLARRRQELDSRAGRRAPPSACAHRCHGGHLQ